MAATAVATVPICCRAAARVVRMPITSDATDSATAPSKAIGAPNAARLSGMDIPAVSKPNRPASRNSGDTGTARVATGR